MVLPYNKPDKTFKIKIKPKDNYPSDTRQHISSFEMKNIWNKQVVQILCEERDGDTSFRWNLIIRLPKPVEISYEWVLKIFNDQEPGFYARLFDESEEGPYEVPPVCTKAGERIKLLPGDPKLCVFQ